MVPAPLSIGQIPAQDRISLARAGEFAAQFVQVLGERGVRIEPGSVLEEICLDVLHWEDRRQGRIAADPMEDIRPRMRRGLSLLDFMRRIVRHAWRPDFGGLVHHLRLMNETFALNEPAARQLRRRDMNNKVFELLVALLCMDVGSDVEIEHPAHSSGGRNPDVLVTIDGVRWGLACKMLNGNSPITHFDRLRDGVRQINDSPAEVGCVVFGLKNLIPHDEIWPLQNPRQTAAGQMPLFGVWPDKDLPLERLLYLGGGIKAQLESTNTSEAVWELFEPSRNRCALTSALLFLQSVSGVALQEGPAVTILNVFMDAAFVPGAVSPAFQATLNKLNEALHHR